MYLLLNQKILLWYIKAPPKTYVEELENVSSDYIKYLNDNSFRFEIDFGLIVDWS